MKNVLEGADFDYNNVELDKIGELRALVETNDELDIGTEDVLLSKFLSHTGWQVDAAYESLLKYYDFKASYPEWVARHSVRHFREHFLELGLRYILPKPDKHGRVIIITKTVDAFDKHPDLFHELIEMDDLIFESLLTLPQVQKYGAVIINDQTGFTKNFLRYTTPAVARMVSTKSDLLPFKSIDVHMVQKGLLLNTAVNIMLAVMSKKFKEHLFSHNSKHLDKLRDAIGYESLPAEYGGPAENVPDSNYMYDFLLKKESYLLKLQTYKKKA